MILTALFDRISSIKQSIISICSDTIYWQRYSAPYMMMVNAVFWYSAFYLHRETQMAILLSTAISTLIIDTIQRLYQSICSVDCSQTKCNYWLSFIDRYLFQKISQMLLAGLCCTSAHFLHNDHKDYACWSAYGAVVVAVVTPAWRHHRITARISSATVRACIVTRQSAIDNVLVPLLDASRRALRIARYWLFFEWLPELIEFIRRQLCRFRAYLLDKWHCLCAHIDRVLVAPIVRCARRIAACCRYWLCGYWIAPMLATIDEFRSDFFGAIQRNIIEPIGKLLLWVRYIVYCEWRQSLFDYIDVHIWRPMCSAGARCRYALVYVCCGYWIPGLIESTKYAIRYAARFGRDRVLIPTVHWTRRSTIACALWIHENVIKSIGRLAKQCALILVDELKKSVLAPAGAAIIHLVGIALEQFYQHILAPTIDYCRCHLRTLQDYLVVNYIAPAWDEIAKHIPEKSPFCDDSDTELKDLLPLQKTAHDESDDESDQHHHRAQLPSARRDYSPTDSVSSLIDDDEHQFLQGLTFPTINDSESSDDEFDLRQRRIENRRPATKKVKRTPLVEKNTVRQRRPTRPADVDDDFEILDG